MPSTLERPGAVAVKLSRLRAILRRYPSAVVAFSGGVDSTLLLRVAAEEIRHSLAVLAYSESVPLHDLHEAIETAQALRTPLWIVRTEEMQWEAYRRNDERRCYHCKTELFQKLRRLRELVSRADSKARWEGTVPILYGANVSDLGDVRPGMEAAREQGIAAPLIEAGLTKEDVRTASRALGLKSADRPSSPCLASRIPHGQPVSAEKLETVQWAESFLRSQGFRTFRVRHFGEEARLEFAAEELARLRSPCLRRRIARGLKALGFRAILLDTRPHRSGRLSHAQQDAGAFMLPLNADDVPEEIERLHPEQPAVSRGQKSHLFIPNIRPGACGTLSSKEP